MDTEAVGTEPGGSHGSTTGTDGQQEEAQESLGKLEKQSRLGSLRRAQSTETMTATKSCLHSATPTALHTVAGLCPIRHRKIIRAQKMMLC